MRRLIVGSAAAALIAGGAGFAFAAPGPGHGHNTFGLCTAYSAGSAPGQAHKQSAPPFAALTAAAQAANQTVAQYCAANGTQPSGK